jgi:type II secretory pathway component PulF
LDDAFAAQTVSDLRRGLHEGRKLSDLIRDRGRLFPRLYSSVIEAGEEAGALPQVMGELRRFLVDSRELRAFILSASIYPLFIVFSGCIMLGIVLGVIVPRFAKVLASTGRQSSSSTRLLLGLSDAAHTYWWIVPLLVVAIFALLWKLRDEESALRAAYDRWILGVPLAGRMVLFSNLSRMCRTMSILMRSGVHLLDVVSIANRVIQNRTLRESIAGLSGELRQGQRLSHALGQSRHVPTMMLRMLAVGEETGAVETMLDRVADRYESDMRRLIKRLLALFEPMIIIVLGLFVGSIVLLMFLAIMDMQSGF